GLRNGVRGPDVAARKASPSGRKPAGRDRERGHKLVLGAYVNAFKTPDLRKKLLFVLMVIVIFRAGSQIPTPGVNVHNVHECIGGSDNTGIYNLIQTFSGGALLQLTIFALGIIPYITAS